MPRTAIISDIHANMHALCAVMEDINQLGCDDIVCLGDIVGYNAYPSECLDYIKSLNCLVVRGNHDEEVFRGDYSMMNPVARAAMEWTQQQLAEGQLDYLRRLPYMRMVRSQFSIVHASLDQPMAWNYILNGSDARGSFGKQTLPLAFHGHTHVPRVFVYDGCNVVEDPSLLEGLNEQGSVSTELREDLKYFVNVGSVGQSRDGDPRACYAVYDSETRLLTLRRIAYDVAAAQAGIRAVGLPEYLAERLGLGQ